MNLEKVVFGFFILLAATLNFGFVLGEIDNPVHHDVYELAAALVVSLIATVLKLGDRTHMGAVLLATSLVADLQLIAAAVVMPTPRRADRCMYIVRRADYGSLGRIFLDLFHHQLFGGRAP